MSLPIYYINLASRPDRRERMERQFAALGLAATRITAVTPGDIPVAEKARFCNPLRAYWLTEVELACSHSHLEALRLIRASGEPYGVVFEDDITLSTRLPQALAAITAERPPVDIIRLEGCHETLRVSPKPPAMVGPIALRQVFSYSSGAAGYLVSQHAADLILRHDWMREKQTDRVLFNPYEALIRGGAVMRHADPALCMQQDVVSDLDPGRGERGKLERDVYPRRMLHDLREIYFREVYSGVQKTWQQYVAGARKRRIPFEAE